MKHLISIFILTLLLSCGKLPDIDNPFYNDALRTQLPNDCVIDAIVFKQAITAKGRLERVDVDARVLFIKRAKHPNHAVCIFTYSNQMFYYDHRGTFYIKWKQFNNPISLGYEVFPTDVESAFFIE